MERCRFFIVFLRVLGLVEVIFLSFVGVWLLLVGLSCECLDGSLEFWVVLVGWLEFEDGREIFEFDGDGGWGNCRVGDGDGYFRFVVIVNSGFLEFFLVVIVLFGKWFNLLDIR